MKQIFIDDLREEFVKDFVFPMFRSNPLYEGVYLLGTSIARPLIAKRQIEIAKECGADAVSHGATGKGNDQIRFEVGYYALKPDVKVIAPWREWDLQSRTKLIAYAEAANIPVPEGKRGAMRPAALPCTCPEATLSVVHYQVALYYPGGVASSDIQQIVLTSLEHFYLRVPGLWLHYRGPDVSLHTIAASAHLLQPGI